MWTYEKKLQFPVNIKNPNPAMARFIITQFGGPDGELAASQRYLSQRYSMPFKECIATLSDIGTEEHAQKRSRLFFFLIIMRLIIPFCVSAFDHQSADLAFRCGVVETCKDII